MKVKLTRNWKIVLLHHTHLDIGFTHTQDEVLAVQCKHLEKAMDLIEQNLHKPEKIQFRWNPEILWAVDAWYQNATEANQKRFVQMVQEGYIGLDGLYANLLTGLCRPEELMASFQFKSYFETATQTKIDSAMITDIPGWNWGLVTALAENGIKYLSSGPNRTDRIGYLLKDWGDQPFYWRSPSKEEQVLIFIHGKGYSWFHSGLHKTKNLSRKLTPRRLARYLKTLERSNYPFDTIIIRYNIGQDNGPPDGNLCSIAEKWNHDNPQMTLEISTTARAMREFEETYGPKIPVYTGDLTPYWEDGAASTARETAIAREAGERLSQASILVALMNKHPMDPFLLDGWKHTLLYNEHTWGAYNSIFQPDHPFVKSQWAWKRHRAILSNETAYNLLTTLTDSTLLSPISYVQHLESQRITSEEGQNAENQKISIINTHNWSVTQILKIITPFQQVSDDRGNVVPSQRLHDGRLAFLASTIPPLTKRVYILSNISEVQFSFPSLDHKAKLKSGDLTISLDEKRGTIQSITFRGKELVNLSVVEQFNEYIVAVTKWGSVHHHHHPQELAMRLLDDGPLITTLQIVSNGYLTKDITTTISLESASNRIYISNLIDRVTSRKKEGIYFAFPFNLEGGRVRYDTIYGSARVNDDQLRGANKNFITATRWVDVSNSEWGVSCALLDAPLFKSGQLAHDPIRFGPPRFCGWLREAPYTGTIYSYIMNNYWMTNYKADQPGKTLFRYVFRPHRQFNEADAYRFAVEEVQPLLVFSKDISLNVLPIEFSNPTVAITSLSVKEGAWYLRLFNYSDTDSLCEMQMAENLEIEVLSPNKTQKLNEKCVNIKSHETILLKISQG